MHAIQQPKGLRKLVLSNSLSDIPLFMSEVTKYRKLLPREVQAVLKMHEEAGATDSEECEKAVDFFIGRHIIRMDPLPEEFLASVEAYKADKMFIRRCTYFPPFFHACRHTEMRKR